MLMRTPATIIDTGAIHAPRRLENIASLLPDWIHYTSYWSRTSAAAAFNRLTLWRQRSRQRRALAQLDDRALHDIGVTRHDLLREISKPFWR